MSAISILQSTKAWYEGKVSKAQEKINEYEKDYESLGLFKSAVETAQAEFHEVHSGKSNALADVAAVKKNSVTAQKYHAGMSEIFSGVGTKVVARVYSVMLDWIRSKRSDYVDKINDKEDDIERYKGKIRDLEARIREEQEKERLAQSGGQ